MLSDLIEIKWSLRQNMWKVATGVFNTVRRTNLIICSGYHSCDSCPDNMDDRNPNNKKGNKYIDDIAIGDYAIVFASGERSVLCVRIISEAYKKEIPEVTIYKRSDHRNSYNTEEVEVCLTGNNTRDYTHTETMVAYVRDIEVVSTLNSDNYFELINKYKCLQTSIAQNRSELRFIRIKK
jgi:tRNA G37 N-methylase TrmD